MGPSTADYSAAISTPGVLSLSRSPVFMRQDLSQTVWMKGVYTARHKKMSNGARRAGCRSIRPLTSAIAATLQVPALSTFTAFHNKALDSSLLNVIGTEPRSHVRIAPESCDLW